MTVGAARLEEVIVGEELAGSSVRRFKPYPAYKPSGVEWLDEIPTHWEVRRLKTIASVQLSNVDKKSIEGQVAARLCNYVDVYYNEEITAELDFMGATATAEQVSRFSLHAGDVLVTKDSESWKDIAVPAVVTSDLPDVLCGYHLALVRPTSESHGAFLARAFSAPGPRDQFQIGANGITRFGLGGDAIRTGLFATPPAHEQRVIAAFLDRETGRIDALVAKKKRLIELLQEKRNALIEQAIQGDPGKAATKLGYYVDLLPGYAFKSEAFSHDPDDIRLLRGVNVAPGALRWDDTVYWPASDLRRFREYQLQAGDLVFGMDRPWIETGMRVAEVRPSDLPALLLQRVARLRARHGLSQRYLRMILSSPLFHSYFEPILTGVSVPHVSPEQILSLRVRFPSVDVQEARCDAFEREEARLAKMSTSLRLSIERSQELRTALIAAAVTGKIDIREEVA